MAKSFNEIQSDIKDNEEIIYVCDLCLEFQAIKFESLRDYEKISNKSNKSLILCLACFDKMDQTTIKRICGPATPESRQVRPNNEGCGYEFPYSTFFL
jgi:hypothetical protein